MNPQITLAKMTEVTLLEANFSYREDSNHLDDAVSQRNILLFNYLIAQKMVICGL